MDIVVEIRDGHRTFRNGTYEVHALNGVSLGIARGEFTAVAGPSGSGKTTLFNILGGLDEPTSGDVILDGRSLTGMKRRELARMRLEKVGFVFQAYNLIPVLSAFENIEYPLILRRVPATDRRRKVNELLDEVGLSELAGRRPAEMSGGQQQRVAIARSLVCEPALVLADEPTANLDSDNGHALMELMRHLNLEHGMTFLFSTHDPMVMSSARRLIHMRDGRIESDTVGADGNA